MATVKELKETLLKNNALWTVNSRLDDNSEIKTYGTGGDPTGLPLASEVVEFKILVPEQKVLPPSTTFEPQLEGPEVKEPKIKKLIPKVEMLRADGLPASVDWRNRWGWPWITTIRSQIPCNACWAFAATALIEAMVRIEHSVWCKRSEGDVHKGMGKKCPDTYFIDKTLDWIKNNGIADPVCFPWTVADIPYQPSRDRTGRTAKIPNYKFIGSIVEQKRWLNDVGPLVTWFEVFEDFFTLGNGVYHKQAMIGNKPNPSHGGHYMLVVGYDDLQGCWIVKNSWDVTWGENGFGRIGYGECGIDKYAKVGLTETNPDPLSKQHMHNGNIFESGNGKLNRNFELVVKKGNAVQHWWVDRSAGGKPWNPGTTFGNDVASIPTFIETTFNRNFELVYRTTTGRLHHWYFDQNTRTWRNGMTFGPINSVGVPGFIQGNYGTPGNFEVVIATADGQLSHWWGGQGRWSEGARFASNVAMSGATLIQSHYWTKGNFELVCVLKNGQMQHWWRDNDHGNVWKQGATFGSGVSSPPVMIEGQFGAADENSVGNFELCVAVGGKVEHWWRNNHGDMQWRRSAVFGKDVRAVVGLLQGSYRFNLEIIVQRNDGMYQHYWRDGAGWHEGSDFGQQELH